MGWLFLGQALYRVGSCVIEVEEWNRDCLARIWGIGRVDGAGIEGKMKHVVFSNKGWVLDVTAVEYSSRSSSGLFIYHTAELQTREFFCCMP